MIRLKFNFLRVTCFVLTLCLALGFVLSVNAPKPYEFPDVSHFPDMPMSDENPVTVEGALLGRYLFYDSILSQDYRFSCSSCHQQAVAFSDAPRQFSSGINGEKTNRNTMPLYNLAWQRAFFWDGRAGSIEEQVFHPVRTSSEMNLNWNIAEERVRQSLFYQPLFKAAFGNTEVDSVLIAKAIAQFERTLISANSKYDSVVLGRAYFSKDEFKGFELANDQSMGDCLHCHTTDADVLGTTAKFSNNGIDLATKASDYLDRGKGGLVGDSTKYGWFRIPSLRNIAVTAPYMHDGRFKTLEEVLRFYSTGVHSPYNLDPKMQHAHQNGNQLSEEEQKQIIAFLNTLTDSVFLSNPYFSNPFEK